MFKCAKLHFFFDTIKYCRKIFQSKRFLMVFMVFGNGSEASALRTEKNHAPAKTVPNSSEFSFEQKKYEKF